MQTVSSCKLLVQALILGWGCLQVGAICYLLIKHEQRLQWGSWWNQAGLVLKVGAWLDEREMGWEHSSEVCLRSGWTAAEAWWG
jgi:hypothetical protein